MSDTFTAEETAAFDAMRDDAPVETPTTEPVATPEPAPAALVEEPAKEPEPAEPKEPKHVPLAALQEERAKRQELREKFEQSERARVADMAKLQERLNLLAAAVAPQPKAPDQPRVPEFAENPEAYVKGTFEALQRELADQRAYRAQLEQQALHQRAISDLQQRSMAEEAAYSQTTPDYNDAVQHLRKLLVAQRKAVGYNDAQAGAAVRNDALQIAAAAVQQGANFADRVYQLALASGYTPKQARAAVTQAVEEAKPVAAPGVSATEQKMATIERGQKMATGLGAAGAAPPTKMTAETLLRMTDEQFAKAVKTADGRALFGA